MAKEKKYNSFFRNVYNSRWTLHYSDGSIHTGYWNASVWKQLFGGHMGANLPVTSEITYGTVISADGFFMITLKLMPSAERYCRKHRVFANCSKCAKWVQAGRIAQHKC